MYKKAFLILTLGIGAGFSIPALAQTDTITNPNRTGTFQDPKTTVDQSKVLLDTTTSVDSLLDLKKTGRNKNQKKSTNPLGESNKPQKVKKAHADSSKVRIP